MFKTKLLLYRLFVIFVTFYHKILIKLAYIIYTYCVIYKKLQVGGLFLFNIVIFYVNFIEIIIS